MASLTKMNNNNMVSNSSEEEKKKAALKEDVPKQDAEKLFNVGPPIKPSFIDYSTDHFKYKGSIDKFIEAMKQLSKEIPFDFTYDEKKYEFEIVAYPNDEKILYAIQLYQEPGTFIIEFRRLDGLGFTYRNHVMKVWTALHVRGIGPGVSNKAKAPMPSLNDVNGRFSYTKVEEVLEPMLEKLGENTRGKILGLSMLLPTLKKLYESHCWVYNPTLKFVKKKGVFHEVIKCVENLNNLNNTEVDRLASAVLKNMPYDCYNCNWELGKRAYDLAMQKIKDYQEKNDLEALEVQRNFVIVLSKMVKRFFRKFNDGDFAKIKSLFKMNIDAVEVENLNILDENIYDLLLFITLGHEQYYRRMTRKLLLDSINYPISVNATDEATRTRDCELELPKIDRPGKSITMMRHSEKSKKMDTYRQELNLHFNTIFTGEGSTSKSYLCDIKQGKKPEVKPQSMPTVPISQAEEIAERFGGGLNIAAIASIAIEEWCPHCEGLEHPMTKCPKTGRYHLDIFKKADE